MKKLLLMCLCFAASFLSNAQTADKKWNIGFHGGATQYKGDLGNDLYKTDKAFYGFGGISISRYLGNRLDFNLFFTKGETGFFSDTGRFRSELTTGTANLRFNILGADAFLRPYIFVGGGAMMFAKNPTVDKGRFDYAAPSFGAGINIRMGSTVSLNIQETVLYSTGDLRDGAPEANENDAFLFHSIGLTFNAGKKKDADGDEVADRKDKCPDTPKGVKVDENGCPVDKDKDGVADYVDDCPDVAGIELLKGCPDKDADGIADKDDDCPDVKGLASLKGCPDADSDGIADKDDKCPDTKAGYKVDATGCPMDNDKDGVLNEDDTCPDMAGISALKGCPDTDGDGVADNEDRCPDVKGTIANKGCPEIAKEDVKKITQIASKIFFEFNKATLKKSSLAQLDALVEILQKYDAANLTIEGHTDNVGDDSYNMELSQKRTESVKEYLMTKGILESRLTAKGFGESQPIADNKTKTGRAQNRRVELKTSY
ncbi:MAG TPA: OmpA family protein [Bacteroidia bacterium]|nr:OmpA family protein [Bacteroidia bacterium]